MFASGSSTSIVVLPVIKVCVLVVIAELVVVVMGLMY